MKSLNLFVVVFISIFLSISLVSAAWPFSITGNVVDGDDFGDVDSLCKDTDGGIKSTIPGVVSNLNRGLGYSDRCINRERSLYEYFCNANGRVKKTRINCEFGCIKNEDGQAYCRPESKPASCDVIDAEAGIVEDQDENSYKPSCGKGSETKIFTKYTCNGDVPEKITEDCSSLGEFGRCTRSGCIGECSDTDAENNKDVSGVVTADGVEYNDICIGDRKIKQYKCLRGRKTQVGEEPISCGANRVCKEGACVDASTAGETTTIKGLKAIVDSLLSRIESLESQIATLSTE
jgi:hypothetical protein